MYSLLTRTTPAMKLAPHGTHRNQLNEPNGNENMETSLPGSSNRQQNCEPRNRGTQTLLPTLAAQLGSKLDTDMTIALQQSILT